MMLAFLAGDPGRQALDPSEVMGRVLLDLLERNAEPSRIGEANGSGGEARLIVQGGCGNTGAGVTRGFSG